MRCSLTHAKQSGRVPSPHAHFGCPFSQGMRSAAAWLLETLAPQGRRSWQKEKLHKSQLFCSLNSTMGEEGDTSAPEVLQRRLGNIPFSPKIPCSCSCTAQPCPTLAAQPIPARPSLSVGAASYLMLLTALAHKPWFGSEWERSVPLSWDVNRSLALQQL